MIVAVVLAAQTLEVGPQKPFARIEEAIAQAKPGDTIKVFPAPDNYAGAHVKIATSNLKIVGVGKVAIDGKGFDYSGEGKVPRAIFQIDAPAEQVTIENFELKGAHNQSHNGAGIRINAANKMTVLRCDIHGNDMGVMSNGLPNDPHAGEKQLIDRCHIHHNGDFGEPGQNHNLYLGGTSVAVLGTEIDHSLTGHNLKSRAHFTLVENCHVHDSANREFDFVEAWDTERPDSNVALIGNRIEKDPKCVGNRGVIHFGQEKGRRDGTLYVFANTIVTPFASPVFAFDSSGAECVLVNNEIRNEEERMPALCSYPQGVALRPPSGSGNRISKNYASPPKYLVGPPAARGTYRDGDGNDKTRSLSPNQ